MNRFSPLLLAGIVLWAMCLAVMCPAAFAGQRPNVVYIMADEGMFFDRDIHERDRRAKFGDTKVRGR